MNPTADPQHSQLLLYVLVGLTPFVLAVAAWALRQNLQSLADAVSEIAADLRQLASRVGGHETSLAAGREKFAQLERRVDGIESRERGRCNECRLDGEGK